MSRQTSKTRRARKVTGEIPDQEKIVCKVCHKRFSFIGTHLRVRHNMTVEDYRLQFGADARVASPAYLFRLGRSMSAALTGKPKHVTTGEVSNVEAIASVI